MRDVKTLGTFAFLTPHPQLHLMILYNITIKIEQSVHNEWLMWMQQIHIPAYLATGLFIEYKFCRILGDEDEHGVTYALQFLSNDLASFQIYQQLHAKRLQDQHARRYPERYVSFRTLMEVVGKS